MAAKKPKESRFIITDIGPNDAFIDNKQKWIGKCFKMTEQQPQQWSDGWFYGDVFIVSRGVSKELRDISFHQFKFILAH